MMKNSPGAGTVVGANVKLQGILKDSEDIVIHGQLDGEVGSDQSILVAENALVKGPVAGVNVTVAGSVKGSIEAKSKLEVLSTGRVNGSITTKELIVQSGAMVNGKISMGEGDKGTSDKKIDRHDLSVQAKVEKEPELEYELE